MLLKEVMVAQKATWKKYKTGFTERINTVLLYTLKTYTNMSIADYIFQQWPQRTFPFLQALLQRDDAAITSGIIA